MSIYVMERADPRNLSANITSSSGRVFRWGPDEMGAGDVPSGMTIQTQMPGGFGQFRCTLQRRPDIDYPDFDRFAPTTVAGPAGALTAFDGYLSSAAMSRGDSYAFSPDAVGWSAHMKDDASFSMVYIERELSRWTAPSAARQLSILQAGFQNTLYGQAVADRSGNPSLQISQAGELTHPLGEMWYDSGANNVIGRIQFTGAYFLGYGNGSGSDANAVALTYTANNDNAGNQANFTTFADSSGGGANNVSIKYGPSSAASTAQRYAVIQHYYSTVGTVGGIGATYGVQFQNLAVIGNHGLTLRNGPSGASPGMDDGFYGGDIVADIIQRAAPLLNTTRGTSGAVVYSDTFTVPQLAFTAPVDADTAIQQLNQYYLYDYGVYEDRAFFWRPPGTGRSWVLRVGEGVKVTNAGPQIETAFNGVVVQYTDPGGATRYVGPPGYRGDADPATGAPSSSQLQDASPTNPATLYGRKRWALLQMGTATWGVAAQVGSVFLQTSLARPSSGTAVVTGFAREYASGRDWPAWMIRAGDRVMFADTSDTSWHYVLNTSYTHDSLQNTLTLDAPPDEADWLISRLGLAISALG